MELKDVNLIVDDPNNEYLVGISYYSIRYGMENIYTDGCAEVISEEKTHGRHASVIRVKGATYVAKELFYDSNESDINKMKNHEYTLISADPVETIKKEGLNNIFNPSYGFTDNLSTANIHFKKIVERWVDENDFLKLY